MWYLSDRVFVSVFEEWCLYVHVCMSVYVLLCCIFSCVSCELRVQNYGSAFKCI